jgi:hypothetical protein
VRLEVVLFITMSEFSKPVEADEGGAAGFFRRWRRPASAAPTAPSRPVPGSVRAVNAASEERFSPTGFGSDSASSGAASNPTDMGSPPPKSSQPSQSRTPYKLAKFQATLDAENVDLNALRKLSWNGVPTEYRAMVWQLLLGYLPTNKGRRDVALARKRKEYIDSIPLYFDIADYERTVQEGETLRQILVDLPRTNPGVPYFHQPAIQKAMERILYIWSIRHPASGYVQGMNDLLTPLLVVNMCPFVEDVLRADIGALDPQTVLHVEADSYWCLTKLLDNIQDHYTSSQPGLQRMVLRLEDLIARIDQELHRHFEEENLQYMQFAFRWMNCLLLRELPLCAILRVWDTYLSEERGGFENFHVYVCTVLLKTFKDKLMTMQFQDILMFLQEIPTAEWGAEEVEPVLSQAFILSTLFEDSPSHLK